MKNRFRILAIALAMFGVGAIAGTTATPIVNDDFSQTSPWLINVNVDYSEGKMTLRCKRGCNFDEIWYSCGKTPDGELMACSSDVHFWGMSGSGGRLPGPNFNQ